MAEKTHLDFIANCQFPDALLEQAKGMTGRKKGAQKPTRYVSKMCSIRAKNIYFHDNFRTAVTRAVLYIHPKLLISFLFLLQLFETS